MDDPTNPTSPWTGSRSAKEKNAVQRAVTALLDELAPERVLKRVEQLRGAIEQHRTPNGCVLQAPTAALSVSWFSDPGSDSPLGELHVIAWRGVVQRRGARPRPAGGGATLMKELVLRPIESPSDELLWRATNGTEYDTPMLAQQCLNLLEEQIGPAPGPTSELME
jgi:hypothetical protein